LVFKTTSLKFGLFLTHFLLEMEESERWLKHQQRVYCSGRSPVEGTPARELEFGLMYGASRKVPGRP
jgi:hypothetical protein